MNAEEARRITRSTLSRSLINPILKSIYDKIKTYAEKGRRCYYGPFRGLDQPPSKELEQAVVQQLQQDGFDVVFNEYKGPPNPYDWSQWEIRW